MFAAPFGRIFWKEYRVHRALWLSLFLSGCALQIVLWWFVLQTEPRARALQTVYNLISLLYAIASGALLFAGEREERTSDWLLSLSVPPGPTLLAKFGFAIVSIIALELGLAGLALLLLGQLPPSFFHLQLFLLITLNWSCLGSLLCRRVLSSVPLIFALCLLPHYLLFYWLVQWKMTGADQSHVFRLSYTLLELATIAANIWLGWRWCQGNYLDGSTIAETFTRWTHSKSSVIRPSLARSRVATQVEHEQSWRRTWQRLVWQERHRETSYWFFCLIAAGLWLGLTILRMICLSKFDKAEIAAFLVAVLIPIPLAMGILGFRSDADFQQPRFLSNRGLSPIAVWLAKQSVWLSRAMFLPCLVSLVAIFSNAFFLRSYSVGSHNSQLLAVPLFRPDVPVWIALNSYACGQLAALLFRRTILAAAFGVLLNFGFLVWFGLLYSMNVPLWWSQGVPSIAMLLITLWQTKPWMLEHHSWSRQLTLLLASIAVPVTMIGLLAQFRIGQALSVIEFDSRLKQGLHSASRNLLPTPDSETHQRRLEKLSLTSEAQFPNVVDEVISLLKSGSVSFPPKRFWEQPTNIAATGLQKLLSTTAMAYLREDSLEKSLQCHLANLRLASLAGDGEVFQWLNASSMVRITLDEMVAWANHPLQTPASIHDAIKSLEEELSRFPSATNAIAHSYRGDRRTWILSSRDELVEILMQLRIPKIQAFELQILPMLTPWERKRAEVLMTRNAENNFLAITELEKELKSPTFSANSTVKQRYSASSQALEGLIQTTPLVQYNHHTMDQLIDVVLKHHTHVRAGITRMALLAHRLKEGQLPERLVQLMESIDGLYLIDPWSNRFFDYYPTFLLSSGNVHAMVFPVNATHVQVIHVGMFKHALYADFRQFSGDSADMANLVHDNATSEYVFPIPHRIVDER